jgi:hypothetical protein
MLDPTYFVMPLIMGHVNNVAQTMKTGYVIFDCLLLVGLLAVCYNKRLTNQLWQRFRSLWRGRLARILIAAQESGNLRSHHTRSLRFRALMHYVSSHNKNVYQLREVAEFESIRDYDDTPQKDVSEYVVDQPTEFPLTSQIYGRVSVSSKETHRDANFTEIVDLRTLEIYSATLTVAQLQAWIEAQVADFKQYLRLKSNEKQLLVTAALAKKDGSNKKRSGTGGGAGGASCGNGGSTITLEVSTWQSTITFANSYFHGMDDVLPRLDFFLHNRAWYEARGIPYNLGILLTGKPGGGKTRFIKQLLNYTGRHGIDIKLNDQMDFTDLQQIIFREQLTDDLILPQEQRLLILEDIDAMGEAVKDRSAVNPVALTEGGGDTTTTTAAQSAAQSTATLIATEFLKSQQKLNLAYLLNMLDGINERSGGILVMTTNKVEVLDKALIRPGRIDIRLHFEECTCYDLARLIQQYWSDDIEELADYDDLMADPTVFTQKIKPALEGVYTPAEVINKFRSAQTFANIRAEFLI